MMSSLSLPVVLLILSCLSCLCPLTFSDPKVQMLCFSMQGKTSGEEVEPPGQCNMPNNATLAMNQDGTHVTIIHRVNTDFCRSDVRCESLDMGVHMSPTKKCMTLDLVKRGRKETPLEDWKKGAPEYKAGGKVDVVNPFFAGQEMDGNYLIITYTFPRILKQGDVTADVLDEPFQIHISLDRHLLTDGKVQLEQHRAGVVRKSGASGCTDSSSTTIYVVIGVVVLLAVVVVVLLLVYLFWRRRQAATQAPIVQPE